MTGLTQKRSAKEHFTLSPPQSPQNNRALTVRAYDAAGNFRGSSIFFSIPATSGWRGWLSAARDLFVTWGWLLGLLAFVLALASYFLIYHLFGWKKQLRSELQKFRGELEHDLIGIERGGRRKAKKA